MSLKRPTVSVIMAAYNVEQYVGQTIESILNQTLGDFELIIRDDASSDATRGVIDGFEDPRVRLLPQVKHVGAAAARNEALAEARGRFIAVNDADDVSEPERLGKQVAYLERNPHIALLGTFAIEIDEENRSLDILERPVADNEIREYAFERGNPFVHSSVMLRRNVLTLVGGYDPRFRSSHDYDLMLRILEHSSAAILEEPLCRFRRHGLSISATQPMRQRAYMALARDMSRVRRRGEDRGQGDLAVTFARRFKDIEAGVFPARFRAHVHREHARRFIDRGLSRQAVTEALRALRARGPTRDNLWMLRQAARSCLGLRPSGVRKEE